MSDIFNIGFIQELLMATIRMAVPIMFAALGELLSERAGLTNIGIDGIMTIGAISGFFVTYVTKNTALGIAAGALAGIAFNMIFAVSTVSFRADQILVGMALNILAPALALFINRVYFGITNTLNTIQTMKSWAIPGLSKIPFLGKIFFDHKPMVYVAFVFVIVIAIVLKKTHWGLNFKAVGENPKAAETLGINAYLQKYLASIFCGALAGIGGAYLIICYIGTYSDNIVSGRGFIALAAVIFGRWSPVGVMLATLFFGFADALQLRLQIINPNLPYQILAMFPYLFTLIALFFSKSKTKGPAANAKAYCREDR